jgi:hypothetical protein
MAAATKSDNQTSINANGPLPSNVSSQTSSQKSTTSWLVERHSWSHLGLPSSSRSISLSGRFV